MTPAIGRRAQRATYIAFFVAGFGMAAWAPLVPFAQARAGIGPGMLGLLLLWLGIGSIATMLLAGALVARFGCRRVVLLSAVPLCLALPLLATAADPMLLGLGLLILGVGLGSLDVTMNIQAVIVERASGRAMMSGFHALFSVGGIAGAGSVVAALRLGATPLGATLPVVAGVILALAVARPHLLTGGSREGALFAMPHGMVLFIGALCFIAFLAEGATLDWSATYLTSVSGLATTYGGVGYAAFSLMMTLGRLAGDRVVQRLGGRAMVMLGAGCAAIGFALIALTPYWPVAVLGFALVGVGCANVVPVLYSSVGRQSAMPEHAAVAAITTLGYAGILAGPAMIGFIAQGIGLRGSFVVLMGLQLIVAIAGRMLRG